jgi:hypothetical protein
MKSIRYILCSSLLVATSAFAQVSLDMSKSFIYINATKSETISATHIKVPGVGNYDVNFKFNRTTLGFDLESASPSQTDENTESLAGIYTCRLYNGSQPIFTTTIMPVGHDLILGAAMQYNFHSTVGSNIWKYTVSFPSGGKYLLSMVKESSSAVTAVLGYLPPGETELDTANTMSCDKKG